MSTDKSPFGTSDRNTTSKHRDDTVVDETRRDNGRDRAKNGQEETARDVQPGTGHEGTSWQSRRPSPDDKDDELTQALKDSFPASDPPQAAQPGVTGWDLTDEEKKKNEKKSAA